MSQEKKRTNNGDILGNLTVQSLNILELREHSINKLSMKEVSTVPVVSVAAYFFPYMFKRRSMEQKINLNHLNLNLNHFVALTPKGQQSKHKKYIIATKTNTLSILKSFYLNKFL